MASATAAALASLALVVLVAPGPARFNSCPGCPPAMVINGGGTTAYGSPGCADVAGEVCYSIDAYAADGGFRLTGVNFSLRASFANDSLVPVGGNASVSVLNSTNATMASWSVSWGSWTSGTKSTVVGQVTFVLDSGLTSGNLSGDVFWFDGGPFHGGPFGGVGVELS